VKQQTLGGVTLTQNPTRPTHHEGATGKATGAGTSWDDFAGYPTLYRLRLYWQANPGLRDFLLYIVFVTVFSIGTPADTSPRQQIFSPPQPSCAVLFVRLVFFG
jgi:hypothetical protein